MEVAKYQKYKYIFSQDEIEERLFNQPIAKERDGEYRIEIKCIEGIKCALSIYQA